MVLGLLLVLLLVRLVVMRLVVMLLLLLLEWRRLALRLVVECTWG